MIGYLQAKLWRKIVHWTTNMKLFSNRQTLFIFLISYPINLHLLLMNYEQVPSPFVHHTWK